MVSEQPVELSTGARFLRSAMTDGANRSESTIEYLHSCGLITRRVAHAAMALHYLAEDNDFIPGAPAQDTAYEGGVWFNWYADLFTVDIHVLPGEDKPVTYVWDIDLGETQFRGSGDLPKLIVLVSLQEITQYVWKNHGGIQAQKTSREQ